MTLNREGHPAELLLVRSAGDSSTTPMTTCRGWPDQPMLGYSPWTPERVTNCRVVNTAALSVQPLCRTESATRPAVPR